MKKVFSIVKMDAVPHSVFASIEDGQVHYDSHNAYDSTGYGRYAVPETGLYNIQTSIVEDNQIKSKSFIRTLKAGGVCGR